MLTTEQRDTEQAKRAKAREIAAAVLNELYLIVYDDHPGLMKEIEGLKLEDGINRIL